MSIPKRSLTVSACAILLLSLFEAPALATEAPSVGSEAPSVAAGVSRDLAPAPVTVALLFAGRESTFTTEAKTFGALLAERGLHINADDYLSDDAATPLFEGMRLEFRPAVTLKVALGKHYVSLHTSALTLQEALVNARIAIGPRDVVLPDRRSLPQAGSLVRITEVNVWTERVRRPIPHATIRRRSARLALGTINVVSRGVTGLREETIRYTRRGDAAVRAVVLSSHVVRHARPAIVENGTLEVAEAAAAGPIATFARNGISSAMHFAGSVFHVIATAYTAGCYGCSGITANGMHAGFGIIAVDPHLIPLGSKLMIPGYGRAIAGDTGGAIVGNRVDLGMNRLADALKFGRRSMTVYILK